MNEVKILHTADLHLGSGRTGVKGGKAEIENTFFRIIRLCETESVDFLLIAGDLFDSPFVPDDDAERIISMLAQIPKTIVAIAPGNHDCASLGSVYLKHKFPENVVVFQSGQEYIDFPEKSVRLYGAAFTNRFENSALMQNISEDTEFIRLGVLHGEVVSETSESVYNPITTSYIKQSGFDYLALGHIHKRSDIQKLGTTSFAYSGCPDGMGFDEPGSRGVYIGMVSKDTCKFEYKEMSSRQYILQKIDISGCKNSFEISDLILGKLKADFKDSYAENLYRIVLTGSVPIDSAIIISQLSALLNENLYYAEVTDETEVDITNLSLYTSETSLRGIFVRKMLERIEAASFGEQQTYKNALKVGLRSFSKGVCQNDN